MSANDYRTENLFKMFRAMFTHILNHIFWKPFPESFEWYILRWPTFAGLPGTSSVIAPWYGFLETTSPGQNNGPTKSHNSNSTCTCTLQVMCHMEGKSDPGRHKERQMRMPSSQAETNFILFSYLQ